MASAAQGSRGRLVQRRSGIRAVLPFPARRAPRGARADRFGAALHPDVDPVARHSARRLQHHDRRIHRRGQAAAAALAVPRAGWHAGERGRRCGDRARLRAAARTRLRRVRRHRETPVHIGQSGLRLVRAFVGDAGAGERRHACRVGGRGDHADRGGVGAVGARPHCRAGSRRRHRHVQQRRGAPLRKPGCRLQPAGCADRARRARREPLHRRGAGGGGSRIRRRAQAAAVRIGLGQGVGACGGAAGGELAAGGGPTRRAGAAGARRRGWRQPRGGGRVGRRRSCRRGDLGRAAAAVGHRRVRRPNRRGAQPRGAQLRRRHRRHTAHGADAIVHRVAVRRVDGPAATPHRTRRLQLSTAALDPHLRLRRGHRRRRLAIGRRSRPQRGVLAPAAGRRRKQQCDRWITQLGFASGDRAGGGRPARGAEGGGQSVCIRQQQGRRPRRSRDACGSSKLSAPQPMSPSPPDYTE